MHFLGYPIQDWLALAGTIYTLVLLLVFLRNLVMAWRSGDPVAGPFLTYSGGGAVSFYVSTNGDITAQSALNATRTALAGITFRV